MSLSTISGEMELSGGGGVERSTPPVALNESSETVPAGSAYGGPGPSGNPPAPCVSSPQTLGVHPLPAQGNCCPPECHVWTHLGQARDQVALLEGVTQSLGHRLAANNLDATNIASMFTEVERRIHTLERLPPPPLSPPIVPLADFTPLYRRLDALESRPVPPSPIPFDSTPMDRRLTALENRLPPPPTIHPFDPTPLIRRLDALENRPLPIINAPFEPAPLYMRLEAIEARANSLIYTPFDLAPVYERLNALQARIEQMAHMNVNPNPNSQPPPSDDGILRARLARTIETLQEGATIQETVRRRLDVLEREFSIIRSQPSPSPPPLFGLWELVFRA